MPADYSDDDVLRRILCIHQPHYVSPVIEKYVRHPRICGVLSQITAAHVPFWDGSVKCMQSMLFVKPPNFQGQAWHQDEIYIPTRDRSLIGAWIAMDDATLENGCLWILPGSHRSGYLYPQRQHENTDEFDVAAESYGFDDSAEIPVEVKTGTVVFFNGYLLHRSRKNRSQIYRRVLVNHYMNAWSLLPWSLKEGEHVAMADRRCIVPVAGIDPYAWKGYDAPTQNVWLRSCKATEEIAAKEKEAEKVAAK
jgi:ectoine hydroxylase-related dioxygenase (phytanoyl-CoA dioxygenase family)